MGAAVAAVILVSSGRAAETTTPPEPRGYYPDLSKPLFLDRGTLICRERTALTLLIERGSGAVSHADTPTCMNMPQTKRVAVLDYSGSSRPVLVHVSIADPPYGTVQGWTALRWLDDRSDCAPGLVGCD